jgi:hypothetical protein
VRTLFDSAFEAHAMFLVPTQVHQNLRGIIDGQVILINRFVVTATRLPVVPFLWLTNVLTGRTPVDIENDRYASLIHRWLRGMIIGHHFLPSDGRKVCACVRACARAAD